MEAEEAMEAVIDDAVYVSLPWHNIRLHIYGG